MNKGGGTGAGLFAGMIGREQAKKLLCLPNSYAAFMVEIKGLDCRSADFRFPGDRIVVPLKVMAPNVQSRIKERHSFAA